MRTIIDLPDDQVVGLASFCKREKISRAEAVRRAVDALLAGRKVGQRQDAFGAWDKHTDARTMVDALRDEWEK